MDTFNLLNNNQLKIKNSLLKLDSVRLDSPLKIGNFAVKNNCYERRELIDNQDDYFFKYTLHELKGKKSFDLVVNWQDVFDKEEEVLRLNNELDAFLKYILNNKSKFLNYKHLKISSSKKDNKNEPLSLEEQLAKLTIVNSVKSNRRIRYDFIALRATLAVILNCQYNCKNAFTIHAQKFDDTIYLILDSEVSDS